MIFSAEIEVLLLRVIYSIELLFLGILLSRTFDYVKYTPIYKTIRYISWSFMILGIIRLFTAFWDYHFQHSTGFYSLIAGDIIHGYLIYVFFKLSNKLRQVDFASLRFNRLLDKMISDINDTISKTQKK